MKNRKTSGSALVIVLGMLSIMMLMAVAFSTFMRTERGATTNLKNAHVAEQSLQTALGLAIQSIEDSFAEIEDSSGRTVVDSPVAVWPQPWIASCDPRSLDRATDTYFLSRRRDSSNAVASVLCEGSSRHLSSNQLAMIRSADVGWAPIYSSIGASSVFDESEARNGQNAGYPADDAIVGRYAFVALDTTGYLDMGKIGTSSGRNAEDARKESSGGDPWAFIPPAGTVKAPDGTVVQSPFKSGGDGDLRKAVASAGAFLSYADVKREKGAGLAMMRPSDALDKKYGFLPPDLYSGCAVSLEELTPEGESKVRIPDASTYEKRFQTRDMAALARRAYPAMMSVFARSRKEGGVDQWQSDPEPITLFGGHPSNNKHVEISKAALATVGLLDPVDTDSVPGESVQVLNGHWDRLKSMGNVKVRVDGRTVSESLGGDGDPLNYPCTESAPLMQMFYAYVTVDDEGTESYEAERNPALAETGNAQDSKWVKTYKCTLHVGAKAMNQNRTDTGKPRQATLEAEFDVMAEIPEGHGVVSKGSASEGNVYENLNLTVARGKDLSIEWKDFFMAGATIVGRNSAVDDTQDGQAGRKIAASGEYPFTVVCGAKKVLTPGVYSDSGEPQTPPKIEYYPLTAYEYFAKDEGGEDKDVWVPVRFKAMVSTSDGDVQQVPAPALDDNDKTWWVRVDMGVYHGADSEWTVPEGTRDKADGSTGLLAAGWAVCLAPQFGMDTTSLATSGGYEPTWNAPLKVWLNNVCARAGFTVGGRRGGVDLLEDARSAFDLQEDVEAEFLGEEGGRRGGVFSSLQTAWLFDNESIWNQWFDESDTACADLMHTLGKDDSEWFVDWKTGSENRSAVRRNSELYTRIPSSGVGCVADLGAVTIGPYETLSLFKTWRPATESGYPESDFHPVMDYFTMDEARYPDADETAAATDSGGNVDWKKLGKSGSEQMHLFSAVRDGRVNLNLPRLLGPVQSGGKTSPVRATNAGYFNPYPLATAVNGAPYPVLRSGAAATNAVSADSALKIASAYAWMLSDADSNPGADRFKPFTLYNEITNLVDKADDDAVDGRGIHRAVVRDASFFASAAGASSNAVLQAFMDGIPDSDRAYLCDYMREGLLRGVADAFTTRGQSFVVAIRADAYTSRFGMEDDPSEGSTLASTHALVELFRDPEPARLPDGTFPVDGNGDPVLYHNWFIRSFRMF